MGQALVSPVLFYVHVGAGPARVFFGCAQRRRPMREKECELFETSFDRKNYTVQPTWPIYHQLYSGHPNEILLDGLGGEDTIRGIE